MTWPQGSSSSLALRPAAIHRLPAAHHLKSIAIKAPSTIDFPFYHIF